MDSVIQEWLADCNLTWKQQTVLLTSLRGFDGGSKSDIGKKLTRRLRKTILKNAAGTETTSFMKADMTLDEVEIFADDSGKYPMHFYMHVTHACEIIGYKHPDPDIREWFQNAYLIICRGVHMNPESSADCDFRLRDGVDSPTVIKV